jgi:thioredoxin
MQGNEGNQNIEMTNDNKINSKGDNNQIAPEYLTYDSFLEKVWDFEANPQEWVYEGDVPCVIDFYADWCKPCKIVAPIMDELAIKYEGKVKIYKINVDKEKKLAGVFGIRSIPSVLFAPASGQPKMQAGALPKEQYIQIIETNLLNNTTSSNQ